MSADPDVRSLLLTGFLFGLATTVVMILIVEDSLGLVLGVGVGAAALAGGVRAWLGRRKQGGA